MSRTGDAEHPQLADLEESIYEWLLPIQSFWPGCGITYRNVRRTEYRWWRIYVLNAAAAVAARERETAKWRVPGVS